VSASCSTCVPGSPESREAPGGRRALVRLVVAGVLISAAWLTRWWGVEPVWVSNALGALAAVLGVYPIAVSAGGQLLRRKIGADLLVTIAVFAALAIEEYRAAGMVAFIMLLGEYLEQVAGDRSERALAKLLALAPEMALVRRGAELASVPASEVQVGEVCVVRPGDRIPVDGEVVAGATAVNEATVTGESLPRDVGVGNKVWGGTLAEDGTIDVRATRVGEDIAISRVRRLVEQARESRAPVERTVDRFASWFAPVAVITALGVWLFTGELSRAITILVVACPCALVLGTPAAVVSAIGRAARHGILIKGGEHLEAAGATTMVALDKTGTLTAGQPSVVRVEGFDHRAPKEVLRLAAIAEVRSEHPLARAIVEAWRGFSPQPVPEPEAFVNERGRGVRAQYSGLKLHVGSPPHLRGAGVGLPRVVEQHVQREEQLGRTVILVAANEEIIGAVSVADRVREGAAGSVASLQRAAKKRVVMLTGDNPQAADAVAREVGIEEVHAEMLPEQKLEHVRQAVDAGHRVAMVGDGVNDAPALAAASVGIAMGAAGSDVALEASDIALMSSNLEQLVETFALSRRALGVIRQNLAFAVLFNAGAVIVASVGWVGPVGGAILHQVSSLAVILNSMRLLRAPGG